LLKPNYDVYLKLLQLLLDVIEEQTDVAKEENNDSDTLAQKKSKFGIDCE
jgi:hypothetical protein